MRPMTLVDAMRLAAERGTAEGWPRCYYWSAVWLRLHAKESKNYAEMMRSSRSQFDLYRDIMLRPDHYRSQARPCGVSDWQWSGLPTRHPHQSKSAGAATQAVDSYNA